MKTRRLTAILATILMLLLSVCGPAFAITANAEGSAEDEAFAFVMDGDGEEWNYITPVYSGGGIISKLSAFTYDGMLYGKMQLSSSANFDTWHIYFDTDGDVSNHLYFTGADYLLETDILYVYKGDSGEWEGLEGTPAQVERGLSSDKKTLEFAIPLADMGNPDAIGIHAATVANWADMANCPENAGEYLPIPKYEEVISEEMAGLTEAEQEAYFASKQFSGSRNQWDSILYDAINKNSNLIDLKAVTDRENLYIHADAKMLSNNFTVYIETSEATYELKANGTIYETKDGKKIDTGTPTTAFNKSDNGFEIAIPTENLKGGTDLYKVRIDDEGECLPDIDINNPDNVRFLEVTASIDEDAPSVSIDGDDSDWKGISPIGHGEGTLGDLYAFRDNEALYVMTYIKGVTDPESSASYTTSLFIGCDNDDSTGFIHSGYKTHNTGDVLIQDWYSYGDDRNLEIFYTSDPVILEWNMKKQYVEGYEKVFKATGKAGEYCAEYKVPFDCLKEFTEAINDDLYVCIDRNDCQTDESTYERLTPEGFTPKRDADNGSFAKVPKYRISFDIKADDYDFGDWNGVCNMAKHEDKVNLIGVKSEEKLYTMLTGNGDLSTENDYFISTDAEGFNYMGRENVSYVIKDGKLFEVKADDELSENGKAVYQYYESDAVLMQCYLDDIGNPAKVRIAADANKGEYVLPEEGYLTITKTIEENREEGMYYPKADYTFHNNPYKGWVGWADILEGDVDDILSEHNLIYVDFKWSEFEPKKGEYAFDAIEKQYQFEKWKKSGCRMVLRFVMDNPNIAPGGVDEKRMDIPEWLYEELEAENAEGEGAGTFYTGQTIKDLLGGCGFSPNYKSPKLLEYHANAIKALAERYDDPEVTAYVEVGSLGHWAEFHTWPTGTGEFPDPALAQQYMQAYVDAFHNVKIGIRKPYALAAENNWGLYNDIFGVTSDGGTPTFLEWAATGNTDMPGSTEEDIAASAMPDWWKLNFSGGEFANGDFRTNALDENICAVLAQIRDSHTTWLGPCSGCDFKVGDPEYDDYLYNIETLVSNMGYTYGLYSISKPESLSIGSDNALSMTWLNSGVAPIYYNCPVTLSLKDEAGNTVYEEVQDFDTTKWLPGRSSETGHLSIPNDIKEGSYTLTVKMNTADIRADIIHLANEGEEADGSITLYVVDVKHNDEKTDKPEQTKEPEEVKPVENIEDTPDEKGNVNKAAVGGVAAGAALLTAGAVLLKKRGRK